MVDSVGPTKGQRLSAVAVILNWNQPELTLRCVRELVADGLRPDQIVVVDNGSTDNSADHLEEELGHVRIVRLAENIGYARASNVGAREVDAEAYVFVNNDAFVHRPGSVDRLLLALRRPGIGIVVPRLLNEDGTLQPSVVPTPSPANALVRATGLSRFVPDRFQPHWSTHWGHRRRQVVEAAKGTVTAVRGDVWRLLGGYVERDLMFSEDLDLCWRAKKAGFATWFEAEAEFVHLGNVTTQASNPERAELVARSDAAMIRAEGGASAKATIALLAAGYAARVAFFRAVGKTSAAAVAGGSLRGYLGHAPSDALLPDARPRAASVAAEQSPEASRPRERSRRSKALPPP